MVNGTRDARLILDTGALHTILSREVTRDLGLLSDPQATSVRLKTAGRQAQAEVVRVESIRVAEAEVRNSPVAVYDVPDAPPGVDGLLGLTFLHQFQVTLDTVKGHLHRRRPPTVHEAIPWAPLPAAAPAQPRPPSFECPLV